MTDNQLLNEKLDAILELQLALAMTMCQMINDKESGKLLIEQVYLIRRSMELWNITLPTEG